MTLRRSFLASLAAPLLARAQSRGAGAGTLPRPNDPAYWAKIRDQFPLARDKVFFNNGTIGAMPKVVVDRTVEHLQGLARKLNLLGEKLEDVEELVRDLKAPR